MVQIKRYTNWMIISANEWLEPIYTLMKKKLLEEKYLHADETTVQVLKETGRANTSTSYMWMYGTYEKSKTPIRMFEYRPTRSGENANEFLKGFNGYLHSDAYQGYNKVKGITRCYCWAHLRRYFVEAIPSNFKPNKENKTAPEKSIEAIGRLFKIEEQIKEESAEKKLEIRKNKSKEIVDEFFVWVKENESQYLTKSKLGKAFRYAINQEEGLRRFL